MTQADNLQSQSEQISAILEQLSEWQENVMRGIFYAVEANISGNIQMPPIMQDWLDQCAQSKSLDDATIQILRGIHIEASKLAEAMLSEAKNGAKPKLAEFDNFFAVYNDLLDRLQRLEDDAHSAEGIDPQTGFRPMEMFEKDFLREQDRFSRSDKPFCVSVVQIDSFSGIKEGGDLAKKQAVMGATKAITECLRTFDDAYRLEEHVYVLCFKNTDIRGGNAALMRINGQISKDGATYRIGDEEYPLSISASIAEVQVSDKAKDLVDRMHKDVQSAAHEPGAILQLQEMSALQQYVNKIDN